MKSLTVFLLSFLLHALEFKSVHGRFTVTSCNYDSCIQQNSAGNWCFAPSARSSTDLTCNGAYDRDAAMSGVLAVHLKQGLAVAYYSGVDNAFLGGADYPIPATGGSIRLCASGIGGDGSFQTLCCGIHKDNALYDDPSAPYCRVGLGQANVTDGCYDPQSTVVQPSSGVTASSQSRASTTKTTALNTPITSTIDVNGTPSVVVKSSNGGNSSSSSGSTASAASRFVLPLALVGTGIVLVGVGVGAYFLMKRRRERRDERRDDRRERRDSLLPPNTKEVDMMASNESLRGDGRA